MKATTQYDEMQEKNLMKIEETGFWLVFWALTAAVCVQALIGTTFKEIAGEMIALVLASIYIGVACLKDGLWGKYPPTIKVNLIMSIVPSLVFGVLFVIRSIVILNKTLAESAVVIIVSMAAVYVVCFAIMEIMRYVYKTRRQQLDEAGDEKE